MFKIGHWFVLVLAGLSAISCLVLVAHILAKRDKAESARRFEMDTLFWMERMRIEANIRMNQKPMTAEEYVEYKIQHPKQRKVYRFNNGRYEWIAEGGEPDLYSMMSSYRMHEFMSERYKRIAVTNCPNCGAPYTGEPVCEYCGTIFQTIGGETHR